MKIAFDNQLAHLMEAGADMFLMPSRYEPCGLNQIYSMKYGTIPVVRATGGLADTVTPVGDPSALGTGFVFTDYTPEAFLKAIHTALDAYANQDLWRRIMAPRHEPRTSPGRSRPGSTWSCIRVWCEILGERARGFSACPLPKPLPQPP